MSRRPADRITWSEPNRYNTYTGRAGKVPLFAISWAASGEAGWQMTTGLPGFRATASWRNTDLGVLQDKAERLLESWLAEVAPPIRQEWACEKCGITSRPGVDPCSATGSGNHTWSSAAGRGGA